MKNPIQKVPQLFARFSRAAWPILTGRPEAAPEAEVRKADQLTAAAPAPGPKLPL